MHSPDSRDFESLRSALWLVLDLIDDLLEDAPSGSQCKHYLLGIRLNILDELHAVRRIEANQSATSTAVVRLGPRKSASS